jgi:ABC-type branched-subunit amino acid transport system substrate-binding protein
VKIDVHHQKGGLIMKRLGVTIMSIFFLFAFTAGAAMAAGAKFGIAVPLTGPYAAMAEDMKKGALLALDEINASGGVLGQPAEVIVRDSQLKGDVALRHFKDMADSLGIRFIGGNLSGGISLVANEYACKNHLLYMSFCHTSLPVGKEFCGYGFTAAVIPYQTPSALANYAFTKLGKKWMSLTADYRWGHDILAGWMVNSEKYGGQFLGNIYHPPDHGQETRLPGPDQLRDGPNLRHQAVWRVGSDHQDAGRHQQDPHHQHQGDRVCL